MPATPRTLRWIPESIGNILHDNGIHSRDELARAIGVGRNTIFRCFPPNAKAEWSGEATTLALYAIAYTFNVPVSRLIAEPAADRATERRALRGQKRRVS